MISYHPRKISRRDVLERQVQRLDRHLERLAAIDRRFFWYRLSAFLVGAVVAVFSLIFLPAWTGRAISLAALVIFLFIVFRHRQLDAARRSFQLSRQIVATQLARLQLNWDEIPPAEKFQLGAHPFAADLNLFGEHSLLQLLDTSITLGGSRRLRQWLLSTAPDPRESLRQQKLLAEISGRVGFRNHLTLQGRLASKGKAVRWDADRLLDWTTQEAEQGAMTTFLAILGGLSLLNLALLGLNIFGLLPAYWLASYVLYFAVYMSRFRVVSELFGEAYEMGLLLNKFRGVLSFLESYPYPADSGLSSLCRDFYGSQQRPSQFIRRSAVIASAASLQNNPILWLLVNVMVPWDLFFYQLLFHLKARLRHLLPAWLDAWYELEALNSLATFAYLHPEYSYPELLSLEESDRAPVFSARALGHPLIPAGQRVDNDFNLPALGQLVIVSGSNMSGKSTFLRTLGINLVLAYAGAPVCAENLQCLPLRVFTCISISDSLSDGISYFYAEVRRLKELLDELHKPVAEPLFFLIDEIFRGTNNRERQIGSQDYVTALIHGHGVGIISTHDLELVHLADQLDGVRNVHFREEVQNDRMVFDYRLRPGPCPTTNALKIMALEGLPVRALE